MKTPFDLSIIKRMKIKGVASISNLASLYRIEVSDFLEIKIVSIPIPL
jgi:hypothetical protein